MALQRPASGSVRARAGPPKGEEARRFGDKSTRWEAELLLAREARRARPGRAGPGRGEAAPAPKEGGAERNSCVRNLGAGRGSRPDRSAGRRGEAVPGCSTRRGSGRGKMAAVKGLETCLRVAGAAAAHPERFLRYCGLTERPPPDAGHRVRARSAAQLVRASVLWEGGLVAAGRRPSAPRGSAELP